MNKILEQLLKKRGFDIDFLEPKYEKLTNPSELPDMDSAIERLEKAQKKHEKIIIYGDYDVDGVTSVTIMKKALELSGFTDIETMLPDRFVDGYGMSQRLVEKVKKQKIPLVITVDCGSNNDVIIDQLNELKTDVIVTDHHEISGDIPKALAVINPKRADFREKMAKKPEIAGLEDLSGAGIAFMIARAMAKAGFFPDGQEKWLLDLAMIGIICDSMTLTRDNRIICKYGMIVLKKTRRAGLKELMRVAGVKKIGSNAIGYQIGPRLNAAGRMENAELALDLLTTSSRVEAAEIATNLNNLNNERRTQQQQAIREVKDREESSEPVIVATGNWNEGIVGIIAGKLTEEYRKPCFVLTEVEGTYKGSGRSFGDFNLAEALEECKDLIISGGGHAAACGIQLEKAKIEEFTEKINEYYRSLQLSNQDRYFDVKEDIKLSDLSLLDFALMDDLAKLEPFGEGNPEPIFLLENMFVLSVSKMGSEQQHLRLVLRDSDGGTFKAVAFYAKDDWLDISPGTQADIWVNLAKSEWNGIKSVEGRILKLSVAF